MALRFQVLSTEFRSNLAVSVKVDFWTKYTNKRIYTKSTTLKDIFVLIRPAKFDSIVLSSYKEDEVISVFRDGPYNAPSTGVHPYEQHKLSPEPGCIASFVWICQ